jgi:putative ABC transport system permease protein
MTSRTLIRRSLRFYWRSHLGVLLGALVGGAALIGALVVGESVRESLRERALARLGNIQIALESGDRLFNANLFQRIERVSRRNRSGQFVWDGPATATLHLKGTATTQDGSARANEVQIYGGTPDFWSLSPRAAEMLDAVRATHPAVVVQGQSPQESPETGRLFRDYLDFRARPAPAHVLLNRSLAEQLHVQRGDTVIIRFPKPSALSQDAVLSPRDQSTAALRATVEDVVGGASFGEFALRAGQFPPLNAFLNLNDLWQLSDTTNKANLVVTPGGFLEQAGQSRSSLKGRFLSWCVRNPGWVPRLIQEAIARSFSSADLPALSEATVGYLASQLRRNWLPADAGIEVRTIEQPAPATGGEYIGPRIEVATPRIFLDPVVGEAAVKPRTTLVTNNAAFLSDKPEDLAAASYVTNGIPLITYLVNAIRFGEKLTPYSMVTSVGAPWTPAEMADDEIILTDWLANDLGLKPGDRVELNYFDPESGARLVEKTNSFKVRAVVPMRGLYADRTLMPEFPGVAHAESTGDWDTGFPLAHKIRDQDEKYWKEHRGTPKAFITLNAGKKMWANRFGTYTAVRYFVPTNGFPVAFQRIVEANLIGNLDPSQLGLVFQPVREQALKAANESQDFGGLFIGFSFFLIVAALLLMAMLFAFGIEQRASEIGTYLALGFPLKQVRRMFLREGIAIAALGALGGAVAGVAYAKGMLWGLATIWRNAVGPSALGLHYSLETLFGGAAASVAVSALAVWLTIRKHGHQPVCLLLSGGAEQLSPSAVVKH